MKHEEMEESYRTGPIGADMDPKDDGGIAPMVIDLGVHRAGNLDESWMVQFGSIVKLLMRGIFGNFSVPVTVKGTSSEIKSFSRALSREKSYLKSISKYGLDNPRTYKSKGMLDKAVSGFERTTGLKWPFK